MKHHSFRLLKENPNAAPYYLSWIGESELTAGGQGHVQSSSRTYTVAFWGNTPTLRWILFEQFLSISSPLSVHMQSYT